jgi:hypothetical protein
MNTSDVRRMKELEKENARLKRLVAEQALDISILECEFKKLLSPAKRVAAVKYVVDKHHVAERRAYRVLQINRTSNRFHFYIYIIKLNMIEAIKDL